MFHDHISLWAVLKTLFKTIPPKYKFDLEKRWLKFLFLLRFWFCKIVQESKQSYSKGGKIAATDAQDDSDDEDDNDDFDTTVGELISRSRNSNSGRNSAGSGINQLPTRPDNPTPPKMLPRRPASAVGCRYIAADAGSYDLYF